VAQAAGVAAYPFLARLAARGDDTGLARTTSRATRGTVFFSFLAAAGMLAIAAPLVRVLFLYGQFTAADAELVAALLAIYALSIPAWGLHQIMARQFYARRKMWTPVVIGTAFTALAIPIWLLARDLYGTRGMAMASSGVMTAYAITMLVVWWRDGGGVEAPGLVKSMGRALAAGTVAGITGRAAVTALAGDTFSAGSDLAAILIGSVIVVGVFMILTFALRSTEWAEMRDRDPVMDDQG
jgi:putative peptidoglycan lipid II flippase